MSEKMKKFFDKEVVDINKYLIESIRINNRDREEIISYVKKPKFGKFEIDGNEINVYVRNGNRTTVFEYNIDFDELTKELVDICDDLNVRFDTGNVKKVMQFSVFR